MLMVGISRLIAYSACRAPTPKSTVGSLTECTIASSAIYHALQKHWKGGGGLGSWYSFSFTVTMSSLAERMQKKSAPISCSFWHNFLEGWTGWPIMITSPIDSYMGMGQAGTRIVLWNVFILIGDQTHPHAFHRAAGMEWLAEGGGVLWHAGLCLAIEILGSVYFNSSSLESAPRSFQKCQITSIISSEFLFCNICSIVSCDFW